MMLVLIVLSTVLLVAGPVCSQNLTCLTEKLPADETFAGCFVALNNLCREFLTTPFQECGFSDCNPMEIACNAPEDQRPDLLCLFNEASRSPLYVPCQQLTLENLTEYCLSGNCSFVEKAYDSCGFSCNPIRCGCNGQDCKNPTGGATCIKTGPILGLLVMTVMFLALSNI